MVQAVVSIGSNIECEKNICAALSQLFELFGELFISPVYRSTASDDRVSDLAYTDTNLQEIFYYNLVVAIETDMDVVSLKRSLRVIEEQQKRVRNISTVTLDLDLLLYGDWVGELDGNVIPHHDITECVYVLRPLSDLLPNDKHPVYSKTYCELWGEFPKNKIVSPVDFIWNDRIVSNANCLPIV